MRPGELYWSRVETVWNDISIYDGPEVFREQFTKAPAPARTLFAAHWCMSEVCNGRFHQFFWNSTGVVAPEAILAFRTIGMGQIADVLERATAWFGPAFPRDRALRMERLDQYEEAHPEAWDPFEDLDDRFFDLTRSEAGGFETAADR